MTPTNHTYRRRGRGDSRPLAPAGGPCPAAAWNPSASLTTESGPGCWSTKKAPSDSARQLGREAAAGEFRGPLHGVPLGIKDIIDVAGFPTRAGSALRRRSHVAEADAPLVAGLRRGGGNNPRQDRDRGIRLF